MDVKIFFFNCLLPGVFGGVVGSFIGHWVFKFLERLNKKEQENEYDRYF